MTNHAKYRILTPVLHLPVIIFLPFPLKTCRVSLSLNLKVLLPQLWISGSLDLWKYTTTPSRTV
jgi:hypothetical protein